MYNQFSLVEDELVERPSDDDLGALIEQARQEWIVAKAYFDNVEDPDLVDYAVYSVEAAERKYMYLMKKAKDSLERFDG
ncbi:MAG: YaaL family protein [Firmicutes bacterium]|nr:YaaL family protein [Bacillota bacterium]